MQEVIGSTPIFSTPVSFESVRRPWLAGAFGVWGGRGRAGLHPAFKLVSELCFIFTFLNPFRMTTLRTRALWLGLLAAVATTAAAQQAPATTTPAPMPNASRALVYKAAPPEQRAAKMSQELARQLGLDAATTAKVQAAALTRDQQIDAIQNGSTSNKDKNTALVANAQTFKAALQGILTPAQYAQYSAHGGKHGGGKKAASPPAAATPAQ